jgi:hypothetical protein
MDKTWIIVLMLFLFLIFLFTAAISITSATTSADAFVIVVASTGEYVTVIESNEELVLSVTNSTDDANIVWSFFRTGTTNQLLYGINNVNLSLPMTYGQPPGVGTRVVLGVEPGEWSVAAGLFGGLGAAKLMAVNSGTVTNLSLSVTEDGGVLATSASAGDDVFYLRPVAVVL